MRYAISRALLAVLAVGAAAATQAQPPLHHQQQQLEGVYSLVGALDGEATLFAARSGAQSELELHLPILRGDRIWTRPYGRLAVLLSDRSIAALDHDSEVTFAQIAGSPDAADASSLFVLHRGRMSLDVPQHLFDSERPVIDTANARVYAKESGRYQVESAGDAWTGITVLAGFAEVVTQRGSVIVRTGEALLVQGIDEPWIELQSGADAAAAALDHWTEGHRARIIAYGAVDSGAYGSALTRHGEWVEIEDRRAWKPHVEDDWQPYSRGRWTNTPSGMYWVARDPWGPLTYHYGSWNQYPSHGWLWSPSLIYAPSHVYWYWGPSYVGWIPRGYYQRHYGGLGFGLRFGLYGWAGGFWDPFDSWIFCPTGYLGYGRGYTYGRSLRRQQPKLSRGIITTDTNGIDYRNWRDPHAVQRVLLSKRPRFSESELPDVTDFVARRRDLNETLRTRLTRVEVDPGIVTVTGGPETPGLVGVTAGGLKAGPAPRTPGAAGSGPGGATVTSGPDPSGLVGVTAGGLKTGPAPRIPGAERSDEADNAVRRRSVPGRLERTDDGAGRTTIPSRRAGSLPTSPKAPSNEVNGNERGDGTPQGETPQPVRVDSGGLRAAPAPRSTSPTSPVDVGEPGNGGAATPTRVATPRSSEGTIDRTRRQTPGRRVLDAIRSRDAAPGPPRTSRPSTPPRTRATPPRTSRPSTPPNTRATPPRTSRPSTPPRTRATAPRTSRPSAPPSTRATPPRTSRPSAPPRTRSAPPRTSRPSTPARTRSAPPRASRPSTPARTRSAPPRTSRPSTPARTRSAPPRTSRPSTPARTRSAPPRASRPSTPARTRSAPPRASRPSTPARTRSAPPRTSRPSTPARTRSAPPSTSSPRSSPPSGSGGRTPPRLR